MDTTKSNRICHDLKTERPDVGQPLPGALRILPILFFATVIGAAVLSTMFWLQFQEAEKSRDNWTMQEQEAKAANEKLKKERAGVDAEVKKADEVRSWVAGSQGTQELILQIVRSMGAKTSMSELTLTRDKNQPEQFNAVVRINGGGRDPGKSSQQQIDIMIDALDELEYRTFAEQRSRGQEGEFDYSAKLVKRADG